MPIEAWCYASPDVRASGGSVDIGLFAESLLYYDQILLNVANGDQMAELLGWLNAQNALPEFLAMVKDGTIGLFDFAFLTAPIKGPDGDYQLWNIQDPLMAAPNTFVKRHLYGNALKEAVPRSRDRKRLFESLAKHVIEVKSEEYGPALEDARADFGDPRRNAILVQAFVDDLWKLRGLGRPPEIGANVVSRPDGTGHVITWNFDFDEIRKVAGERLEFQAGAPLTAGAHCNRQLWAAAREGCDLFLPSPISVLTGDKLYETVRSPARITEILDQLNVEVEFPDVRRLVNDGELAFVQILELRRKAGKFREWLQSEADRDRNAIVAYHNEVGKESGLQRAGRKSLSLFAVAAGAAAGSYMGGPLGVAAGAAVGGVTSYVLDLASKIGADWKPVVFGNWMGNRIEKFLDERVE